MHAQLGAGRSRMDDRRKRQILMQHDLDAEQEVDFGRYWRLIALRWWLPVGLLVAGILQMFLADLGRAVLTAAMAPRSGSDSEVQSRGASV